MHRGLVGIVLCTVACGSKSSADLSPFLGFWSGNMSVMANDRTTQAPASFIFLALDSATLEIVGFCSDYTGPRATVSNGALAVAPMSCPVIPLGNCNAVTISIVNGTGTVESGTVLSLTLSASVSGCSQSFPAQYQFAATRDGSSPIPVAKIAMQAPSRLLTGMTVHLDGTASTDPVGEPLTYAWTVTGPPGSDPHLNSTSNPKVDFGPDTPGLYTITLVVSDGSRSSAPATATITAEAGVTTAMPYRPTTARYSRALDRLVFTTVSPAALHLYDPVARADVAVALPAAPTCLGVSTDGLYAAVGHDRSLTYVDLAAAAVIETLPIPGTASDVVLGEPITVSTSPTRFAYVFQAQSSNVYNVDLDSGAVKTTSYTGSGELGAALEPGTNHVFVANTSYELLRLDAGADGVLLSTPWVTTNGYLRGPLWISPDGTQLLAASGARYRPQDLTSDGGVAPLLWADLAPDGAHWLLAPTNSTSQYGTETAAAEVDANYLGNPAQFPYPEFVHAGTAYDLFGRYVFYDSTGKHRIAVAQVDPTAGALLDFVALVL